MADLGNLGESELERWCHSTDLIVNKSLISDKAGWDHIIDFPYDIDILEGKVHASAYQCKIQVKATQTKNKKVQIKLSNLRRMVTDPIPNFILFLEYDKELKLEAAYLSYIDKTLIKRIMEKIHTLTTKANKKELKLHSKKMIIKFEPHHLLISPSGITLKSKIEEYIGKDFQQCVVNKKEYLERVGFNGSPERITITTTGEDNLEKLIDISLGRDDSVEIATFKKYKERFGQAYDIEENNEAGGVFSMKNIQPSKHGSVTFKSHPFKAGFTFSTALFVTPLIKDFKHKLFKYRLKSPFFEMTVQPAKNKINFKFSLHNIEMEILQYYEAVQLLQQISSGQAFDIIVTIDESKNTIGKVQDNSGVVGLEEESTLLKNAISILNSFDIKTSTIVNIDELLKYKDSINPLSTLLDDTNRTYMKVSFDLIDGELNQSKKAASVGVISTIIGKHVCSFIYVLTGYPTLLNHKYEISSNEYVIEEKLTHSIDDDIAAEVLEEILNKIEDKYEDEYQVIANYKESNNKHN